MIFAGFGAKLPMITRVIVGASDLIRHYGPLLVIAIAVGVYMVRAWVVSPTGRRTWEWIMLRMPVIGSLLAQYAMARFCRMLGTLLGAGVPLVNGLNVARR